MLVIGVIEIYPCTKFRLPQCFSLSVIWTIHAPFIMYCQDTQSAILKEVKGLTNKLYAYALAWKKTGLLAKFQVHRCFDMDLVCIVMYSQDTKERG